MLCGIDIIPPRHGKYEHERITQTGSQTITLMTFPGLIGNYSGRRKFRPTAIPWPITLACKIRKSAGPRKDNQFEQRFGGADVRADMRADIRADFENKKSL